MSKDLIISSNRHETKVAILEDEQLVEIYFQRANQYSLVGSIHKGRVTRVLPGMQSAFVDIGLDRDAFLYVSDFFEDSDEYEPIVSPVGKRNRKARAPAASAGPAREHSDGRDKRGRRSRRRRTKGHGLPESKYASETRETEPVAREAKSEDEEFLLLPGESLAKYGRGAEPAEIEEVSGEAKAGQAGPEPEEAEQNSAAGEQSGGNEPPPTAEEPPEEPVEAGAGAAADEPGEESPPAGEGPPPEAGRRGPHAGVEPKGEQQRAVAAGAGREAETSPGPVESGQEPETGGAGDAGDAPNSGQPQEEEAVAEGRESSEEGESEDAEIRDSILGPLAAAREAAPEQAEHAAPERSPEAEQVEGERASAQVREQETRYPHRISRRGRRRGRANKNEMNGGRQETHENSPGRVEKNNDHPVSLPEKAPQPLISDLLKEGQEILVQVAKEPLGRKGARITSHIALPGRYVVYMPTLDHLGVSRKISSEEERQRLRQILQTNRAGMTGGFIMRTAGEGKSEREIAADMKFLFNLWMEIREKAERKPAPVLLHHDLEVIQRVLRDQVTEDFHAIWVDHEEAYESVLRFLQRFQPSLIPRVRMYTRSTPIFDAFNITEELEKALRPKVWLKSGGYIVINQTEALVAIDINTGKYVGKSNRLEDTIVKTNIEAVKEIARQMRLRDLGGIIVVDFIDMDERKNRQKVMQALEEAMRSDRAPYKTLQFNDFGLVAITRKRVKQSLEHTLCSPCPYCEGAGYVKSVDTIIGEILTEAHKLAGTMEGADVMLRVHPDVAKVLKAKGNSYVDELEEIFGRPVLITADPLLHHEKFALA